MTPRSPSQRLAAWLLAALLALVVGEPLRVHECPVHLRSVTEAAATDDAATPASGHHAHDEAADGEEPPSSDHGGHACDCLGDCSTVAPVAAPRAVAVRTVTTLVAVPVLDAGAPLAALPAGEHVLPFAIGPPARA
jgi:hypothetical protein